ncbi:MAG: hypothetical protein CL908_02125 [Deltaproteobacteria bacterium]|nr:hypothetical protein [Deltaproteobacteria bacterium]
MPRIKRSRRVRCKLPCEIVRTRGRRARGRVVTLSEGGLAVITNLHFDQGDAIRLLINPESQEPVKVSAIVWNEKSSSQSGKSSQLSRLGCVVSEPSRSFTALLDRLAPPTPRSEPVPLARPQPRDPDSEWCEPDLPRSRELQPPPKSEPEERLPYFRVRLKQIGGPRTRILTIRARSATQAERLAHEELAKICKDSEGWGVLHISRVSSGKH